jgi:polyhydroxyalkanoate synthesis regulator phasin
MPQKIRNIDVAALEDRVTVLEQRVRDLEKK